MSTNRLNYWSLLAQEHEQEVQDATHEGDIPRALTATMKMAYALENARITDERGE